MKSESYFLIGALTAIACIGLIITFYFSAVGLADLKKDTASLGQFGDYLGGILNPLIGLVTAYFAYQAYQNTKISAQQQKFSAAIEMYKQIYEKKVNTITFIGNNGNVHSGAEALREMVQEFDSNIEIAIHSNNSLGTLQSESSGLDTFILKMTPMVKGIIILEKNLSSNEEKLKFFELIEAYSDVNFVRCIEKLSLRTNYLPSNPAFFENIQHLAQKFAKSRKPR